MIDPAVTLAFVLGTGTGACLLAIVLMLIERRVKPARRNEEPTELDQ
jgi:hypothetical protein